MQLSLTLHFFTNTIYVLFFAQNTQSSDVVSAISVSTLYVTVEMATIIAANHLHRTMLHNIMHVPLSFFDTTPVGRILSRFASDIETLDDEFCDFFQFILDSVFEV